MAEVPESTRSSAAVWRSASSLPRSSGACGSAAQRHGGDIGRDGLRPRARLAGTCEILQGERVNIPLFHGAFRDARRQRGDGILPQCQLGDDRRGQQIAARAQRLTERDEARPQGLERLADPPRPRRIGVRVSRTRGQQPVAGRERRLYAALGAGDFESGSSRSPGSAAPGPSEREAGPRPTRSRGARRFGLTSRSQPGVSTPQARHRSDSRLGSKCSIISWPRSPHHARRRAETGSRARAAWRMAERSSFEGRPSRGAVTSITRSTKATGSPTLPASAGGKTVNLHRSLIRWLRPRRGWGLFGHSGKSAAREYVRLAEYASGAVPRAVDPTYIRRDGLGGWERMASASITTVSRGSAAPEP
jgi:hypothetical protein